MRIFFSYAKEDIGVVSTIYDQLRTLGLNPWMYTRDLLPGQQWREVFPDTIQRSDFVLIFLSPRSVDELGYLQHEIRTALEEWKANLQDEIYLIPIRLEPCQVPKELGDFHWIDLYGETGWSKLLRAILEQTKRLGQEVSDVLIAALPPPMVLHYRARLTAELGELQLFSTHLAVRTEYVKCTGHELGTPFVMKLVDQSNMVITRMKQIRAQLKESIQVEEPIWLELLHIPASGFLMGSDQANDYEARENESPQHQLFLPDFYIGKTPITNEQYAVFVEATKQELPLSWENAGIPDGMEQHPVVGVGWYDAVSFCEWLSEETGKRYYLPSEAEWEKAARGIDGRLYPWGNEKPNDQLCNFDGNVGGTTPVGQYPNGASPYGVLDMGGNVWEWTSSLYKSYPYTADDSREIASTEGGRVVRGGYYSDDARSVRCAVRHLLRPHYRHGDLGFRVVLASPSDL